MKVFKKILITTALFAMAQSALAVWTVSTKGYTFQKGRYVSNHVKPTTNVPQNDPDEGKQRVHCLIMNALQIDPIVNPGAIMSAHMHVFYGNPTVNKDSTLATLSAATSSSCAGGSEYKSSFWAPAMVDTRTGVMVGEYSAMVYYASTVSPDKVQPLPRGLKMLKGDAANLDPDLGIATYSCADMTAPYTERISGQKTIPSLGCPAGSRLRENITFNQCLHLTNGIPDLDSVDHKSHVVEKNTGDAGTKAPFDHCPTGYELIPYVTVLRDWRILNDDDQQYWRLASDPTDLSIPGGVSAHADYFMAMPQYLMDLIVNNCIRTQKNCQTGLLGQDPADGNFKQMYE